MQNINWDDLRYLIALNRCNSHSEAARLLGVNSTTVSRRVSALEASVGDQLVMRNEESMVFTETGHALLNIALETQEALQRQQDHACNAKQEILGEVLVSGTPAVCNRLLMPHAHRLLDLYPNLQLQLWPENNNLDIRKHHVDIALRLGRPESGGQRIKTLRLGTMSHAAYANKLLGERNPEQIPWIGYSEHLQHLAHVQWIEAERKKVGRVCSPIRVLDLEAAIEAAAHGLGQTILPTLIG
ncbi:MAG: LysR family transcriptional regulator, partial [Granulosicoccaceae bacterium]